MKGNGNRKKKIRIGEKGIVEKSDGNGRSINGRRGWNRRK